MTNFDIFLSEPKFTSFAEVAVSAEKILNIDTAASVLNCRRAMEFAVKWMYSVDSELKLPWDGWDWTKDEEWTGWTEGSSYTSKGVGKLSKVSAEDKSLFFCKVTGVESEEIADENMKYMGMNEDGQLIVCYSDDNMVKKDGDVGFAYIFVKAE